MNTQIIEIGDSVRHKTKLLNGNMPMNVCEIQNSQACCEHFEPNEEGGTTHKKAWFPFVELDKVIYGSIS